MNNHGRSQSSWENNIGSLHPFFAVGTQGLFTQCLRETILLVIRLAAVGKNVCNAVAATESRRVLFDESEWISESKSC